MADSDDDKASSIPAWQRDAETSKDDEPQPSEDHLETARRFLDDEAVKDAPREKKVAFLKGKGIEDGDIGRLLGSEEEQSETESSTVSSQSPEVPTPSTSTIPESSTSDRAPVITYPEFLTSQSQEAKAPLITTSNLLTTLQITSFLSAVLVGTSKFILNPMLDSLTSARVDLHSDVHAHLNKLLEALEKSVSVVPDAKPRKSQLLEEEELDDEDPTECFHIDASTQTSYPIIPSKNDAPKPPPSEVQTTRLEGITKSLNDIRDGLKGQTEDLGDIKMLVDVFRDDLDALTYKVPAELEMYGTATTRKNEPEDETKKVRDSIRRIKGMLLTTRSFPANPMR